MESNEYSKVMKKATVRFNLSMSEPLQDDDFETWSDTEDLSEADEEVPQLLIDPHFASINDQYKEMLAREAQEELDRQVASALLEEDQNYLLKNKQIAPPSKPITEPGLSADVSERAKVRTERKSQDV